MQENTPVNTDAALRRKANIYFFSKVVFNLLLIILGAVLIASFLRRIQMRTALAKQTENCELAITEAVSTLRENEEDAQVLTRIFHDGNQDILDDLWQLFSGGLSDSLLNADTASRTELFQDIVARSGADYLFMLSPDSKIILSPDASLVGVNPSATSIMTQENINRLLRGTVHADGSVTPVTVKNQYGTYYFYSMPYAYQGVQYSLVLGTSASMLDLQVGSLRDLSVVLSRAAVSNDGFLFAVDKADNTFLYYKNGTEVLTGQSALKAGLSEAALEDGYTGIETIRGIRYYCVSRTYGDRTVICAVADTSDILHSDRYVVFWSMLGFILVMILCLSYAIVVRNDYVRRAVDTDRVVLNPRSKNPIYFDKSIFRRILPLMILGFLAIFVISFYTQTLLEITEGVEKSGIALDEVTGRYEESLESREIIRNYYDERFLSKARLISFLIEEDPAVLNAETNRYYTALDEDGNRYYFTDDEGNHLRSVSSSARLQDLCDANDIEAIYIFDEDGRTIATNTDKWYHTISSDPEDPSSEFLQLLDGTRDTFIQAAQTDENGVTSQFVGAAMKYYTTRGDNGRTRYVSRFEYEHTKDGAAEAEGAGPAADGADKAAAITAHKSMVQIALDEELADKLLDSTDVAHILSTNMLSGGFIVMFDATEEHRCVYSPNAASIGRTAADLGVSANAFGDGDYYGYSRVNGVRYFQYFRFLEGYYIATAMPLSAMYVSRFPIAAITSLISLFLILFLSLTVTLTDREEETLYKAMSEEQAARGLNNVIFNIILPSGRGTTTVKAAARWDARRIPWSEKSPEQKLAVMVGWVCAVILLYVFLSIVGLDTFFEENSVIHYIIRGSWDKGFNIFAISSCALFLCAVGILISLIRIPISIITSLLGTRGETIGHLLLSVIKYGGALGALFYCLYLVGIDSSSLLASAGILSLVIGLGAQSLIKDILAGIFIVFEGEFRVGDIVTISGYRGTVMDIGLRTTKIMGMDGNIKILNNSEISGILNMTQEASIAACSIGIEYGQDLDYVEAIMNRDLPLLRKNNPAILDGPTYLGVSELAASSVNLIIICKCSEKDVKGVARYLNKEVLKIFYRNGINVPFPNVTVSQLDMTGRKTIRDFEALTEQTQEGQK